MKLLRVCAFLAVVLGPLLLPSVGQARPAAWPVYPSLFYSYQTCNVSNNYAVCQPGGLMQSQINSGYQCNEIDVSENGYSNGPILLTMSVNSQSQSQSITIDSDGNWYIQFPGYLVNNLVSLEFSMPDGAAFTLPTIQSNPCPVATSTPTPAPSNTPNPSDTPTPIPPTNTAGPSPTITAIPTHTPLPHGHSTFTPTTSPTPANTNTPAPSYDNCGSADFPVLNCHFDGGTSEYTGEPYWTMNTGPGQASFCYASGFETAFPGVKVNPGESANLYSICYQQVTAHANGDVWASLTGEEVQGTQQWGLCLSSVGANLSCIGVSPWSTCPPDNSGGPCVFDLGTVTSGTTYWFSIAERGGGFGSAVFSLNQVWVGTSASTPTPGPPTSTPTQSIGSVSPTATKIPNPFATVTPPASATPCPSGCAVSQATGIPIAIDTIIGVDTSPLTPLEGLSLGRTSCQSFGRIPVVLPNIIGTPAYGASNPISVTWTAPLTGTGYDFQPCADPHFSSAWWDSMWNLSIMVAIIVWIGWLIWYVRRLFS